MQAKQASRQVQKPAFREAFLFWLKLGFISFGGPAGQISIMHAFLVEKKKWISNSRFLNALNYCMLLPGPEAQQLAIYTGWLLHGTRGGLLAGAFFVLPSMFILLALSAVYVSYGNLPWVYAIFDGLKPAVIAIIILAMIKISQKSLISPFHYVIAILAFLCISILGVPFPIIILGALVIALIARYYFKAFFDGNAQQLDANSAKEDDYYINKNTQTYGSGFNIFKLSSQTAKTAILWFLPLAIFYFFTADFLFWKQLSLFFTQAAFVTFGGAYAVLPYVAQVSVEQYNWLSSMEMVDGLALGETTPGPLVMVLTFVGFMAGYNHFDGSIAMGALGLFTTTFYTFLPCFLFIFAGAPIIERTQGNKKLHKMLSLVTAAVVGVMLNLALYLTRAIIFPEGFAVESIDFVSLLWVTISLFALKKLKINLIAWIGFSGLFGLAYHFVTL